MSRPAARTLFIVPGGVALLVGVAGGLRLLGLDWPTRSRTLAESHGVLMVLGFVGTLVATERAVALGRWWAYAAPLGLAAGPILLLTPLRDLAGAVLLVGSTVLVALYLPLWRRQRDPAVGIQAFSAVFALVAAILLVADQSMARMLPWLVAFLVLTIVGERLELARLGITQPQARALVMLVCGYAVAVAAALLWPQPGTRLMGFALLGIVGWLLRFDVARRTINSVGLPRYMAVAMTSGQLWLGVAALLWIIVGPVSSASDASYDALIHAVFLGFTMSMIFAHAPVILPAVTRVALPYHWVMYLPLALLQLTLLLRLLAGDAWGSGVAWQVGGVGNVIAILLFIAIAVWRVSTAPGRPRAGRSR